MIRLNGIYKTYQTGALTVPVLKDVNFTIEAGEFVAIMGPSGSGKSTLMNIIGCLDRPTAGEYWLDGKLVSTLSDDDLALLRNRTIGFIFQSFNLLPKMTAQRNVEQPLIYAGHGPFERPRLARQALERVGLGDRVHHRPAELSGGQRQRVAVARALVTRPSLLLADEPTGSLDTKTGQEIMELFQRLHAEGATIVLVTHEPEVAQYARRIITVRDGQISEDRATGGPAQGGTGA